MMQMGMIVLGIFNVIMVAAGIIWLAVKLCSKFKSGKVNNTQNKPLLGCQCTVKNSSRCKWCISNKIGVPLANNNLPDSILKTRSTWGTSNSRNISESSIKRGPTNQKQIKKTQFSIIPEEQILQ